MKTRVSLVYKLVYAVIISFFVAINVYASDYEAIRSEGRKEEKIQQKAEINYQSLTKTLDKHLQENPKLFDSSKDKDIVVFLGKTGAGKSTLINYLSEKELVIHETGDVVLKNPEDKSAMSIGIGARSQTRLPQFVNIDGLLFYDLPGLDDTEGASHELINASFIRHIIENARSTRIVAVAGLDEVISGRGRSFKDLVSRINGLLPSDIDIGECSSCIITRSDRPGEKLIPYLKVKVDKENLYPWILSVSPRISQMSKPEDKIDLSERKSIISTIMSAEPMAIRKINTKVLYSHEVSSLLKGVLKEEMSVSLNNLVKMVDKQISEAEDKPTLDRIELIKPALFQRQLESEIDSSKFITLLKPFLNKVEYAKVLSSLVEPQTSSLQDKVNLKLKDIQLKAEEKAKAEAQKKAEEQTRAAEKSEKERKDAVAKAEEAQKKAEEQRLAAEKSEKERKDAVAKAEEAQKKAEEQRLAAERRAERDERSLTASLERLALLNSFSRYEPTPFSPYGAEYGRTSTPTYAQAPAPRAERAPAPEEKQWVNGYTRSNGTKVAGYWRKRG